MPVLVLILVLVGGYLAGAWLSGWWPFAKASPSGGVVFDGTSPVSSSPIQNPAAVAQQPFAPPSTAQSPSGSSGTVQDLADYLNATAGDTKTVQDFAVQRRPHGGKWRA